MIFKTLLEISRKKYELTNNTIKIDGKTLHQIKAIRKFSDVKSGELGGYIEKESNLSHEGDCWVYGNAQVYGNALAFGNAKVSGDAQVYGSAKVYGNCWVYGNAQVYGNAKVFANAIVSRSAQVYGISWISEYGWELNECKDLDTLIDVPELITLKIIKCPKLTSISTYKHKHNLNELRLKDLAVFDITQISPKLTDITLQDIKVIKGISILACYPIKIDTNILRLKKLLPELKLIQCQAGATAKQQRIAMWEFQELLINSEEFTEEEYEI